MFTYVIPLVERTPNLASPTSHRSEPLLVSLADQKAQPPQGKVAYFLDHPKTERLWHHYVQNPVVEHLVSGTINLHQEELLALISL